MTADRHGPRPQWQGSVWTLDHLFWIDLALATPPQLARAEGSSG